MKRPNRFLDRPKARRVAAFVTSTFPRVDQAFAYSLVQRLSLRIDADYRFPYVEPVDPRQIHADVKAWISRSLIAPYSDHQSRADIAHFRHTHPGRLDALLQALAAAFGAPVEHVLARDDVRIAFGLARITKAWAPDVLFSFHAFEGSLHACLAQALLDVPRALILYDPEQRDTEPLTCLLPLHVEQACVIAVPTQAVLERLRQRFGERIAAKTVSMEQPNWEVEFSRRIAAQLRRQPPAMSRLDLGPAASFRTDVRHGEQPEITPFVVAGAARTGSNLLIDMLLTHPRVVSAGELFNTRMIDDGTLDIQLPADVDKDELLRLRRDDPAACCRRLLQIAQQRQAAVSGFKLLYFHAVADNRIVDYLLSLPTLRIVHLTRDDRLTRWVSQVRAHRSDSWWVAADQPKAARIGPVPLDPMETLSALEFEELQEERFRATFTASLVMDLTYEQLADDVQGRAGQVLDFLELPRQELQPQSQKTGDRDVRQLVSNWPELVDAFVDTRWEDQFVRS